MAVLSSASVNRSFWGIVEEWERVRTADHLLEIASELSPGGAQAPAFEVLLRGCVPSRKGAAGGDRQKGRGRIPRDRRWGPDLAGAVNARERRPVPTGFLASEGGSCARPVRPPGIPLSLGAVKTWRALQARKTAGRGRLRIPVVIAEELRVVIPGYVEYCLGKQLRSLGGSDLRVI